MVWGIFLGSLQTPRCLPIPVPINANECLRSREIAARAHHGVNAIAALGTAH